MSKKQGLFDAAIKILRDSTIRLRAFNIEPNDINFAIRVLKDWPKWKPLIEAAGKTTNRSVLMSALSGWKSIMPKDSWFPADERDYREIRDLLESLPAKEEK